MAVYLAPREPLPSQRRLDDGQESLGGSAWGFGQETATDAVRLMLSGLFDDHSGLQVILGHLGEGLPFTLPRLEHRLAKKRDGPGRARQPASRYLSSSFLLTTGGHAPRARCSTRYARSASIGCCSPSITPSRRWRTLHHGSTTVRCATTTSSASAGRTPGGSSVARRERRAGVAAVKITAAVAEHRQDTGVPLMRVQELDLDDDLHEEEVLVRVVASGVCRLDLEVGQGNSAFPTPCVLGHEGTGIVERIGTKVLGIEPGAHVLMSFPNDGTCDKCLEGKPRQCRSSGRLQWSGRRSDGSPSALSRDGQELAGHMFQQSAFATHVIATQENCVVVPDGVPLELFVIGCGVMTGAGGVLNVLAPEPGSSIAVFGVGGVGSSAVMAARISGCEPIIAVEPVEHRRRTALRIGATHVVDPGAGDVVAQVEQIVPGGSDFSIVCVGDPTAVRQGTDVLGIGGTCGIIGDPGPGTEGTFAFPALLGSSRTIRGINGGEAVASTFLPRLIDAHARGLLPLEQVVRTYPLERVQEAMDDLGNGAVIKPMFLKPAAEISAMTFMIVP